MIKGKIEAMSGMAEIGYAPTRALSIKSDMTR
jgi:hypothetical protein